MIDTRNDYEIKLGSFPGGRSIRRRRPSEDFPAVGRSQPRAAWRGKKIAMFCPPAGIRCEKATALMRKDRSRRGLPSRRRHIGATWRTCRFEGQPLGRRVFFFVFDEGGSPWRHGLKPGEARLCRACPTADVARGAVVDAAMSRGFSLRSLPCGADGSRPRAVSASASGRWELGQATQGQARISPGQGRDRLIGAGSTWGR